MLKLKSIRLFYFKNYRQYSLHFDKPVIGITGANGTGKTNLLDAIYYLSFTRSYFNSREKLNALHGQDAFRIEGLFLKEDKTEKVNCVYKNAKKEIQLNDTAYERFSQHIGLFPAVFIAPDDGILITGGSELRRRFLDVLLSQIQPDYLDNLIAYQKVKMQRNSFLKNADEHHPNTGLMDVFDRQLVHYGQPVYEIRKDFINAFAEKTRYYYQYLSGGKERIEVYYNSALHQDALENLLRDSRRQDYILRRTTRGIHRDDLDFMMDGKPLKQVGSQGQKKSFVFALKLAQFDILKKYKRFTPVLLLDDIFEKLDSQRIQRLIGLICGAGFGQVFITDTEEGRLKKVLEEAGADLQLIKL